MAQKTVLPTIDQWPPVIILGGSDTLGREKCKEQLFEKLYTKHTTFLEEYFDTSRESIDEYLVRVVTPTIFGDFRLFHIPHVQKLSLGDTQKIAEIFPHVGSDALLLVEYEPKAKKSSRSVAKELSIAKNVKKGLCLNLLFDSPKKYQLADWLTEQVKTLFSRRTDKATAELLIDYVGDDIALLYSELQKLDIYLPDGAPITKSAVEVVTGISASANPYDLANSLGQRKWRETQELIQRIFANNAFKVLPLVAIIYRHFWKLYKIRCYAEAHGSYAMSYFSAVYKQKNEIAHTIGVATGVMTEKSTMGQAYPLMVIPDMIGQARSFTLIEIQEILEQLTAYDREVKSGQSSATEDTFRHLCYMISRHGKVEV